MHASRPAHLTACCCRAPLLAHDNRSPCGCPAAPLHDLIPPACGPPSRPQVLKVSGRHAQQRGRRHGLRALRGGPILRQHRQQDVQDVRAWHLLCSQGHLLRQVQAGVLLAARQPQLQPLVRRGAGRGRAWQQAATASTPAPPASAPQARLYASSAGTLQAAPHPLSCRPPLPGPLPASPPFRSAARLARMHPRKGPHVPPVPRETSAPPAAFGETTGSTEQARCPAPSCRCFCHTPQLFSTALAACMHHPRVGGAPPAGGPPPPPPGPPPPPRPPPRSPVNTFTTPTGATVCSACGSGKTTRGLKGQSGCYDYRTLSLRRLLGRALRG